ncbi:PI-PLC X domain-containing protein 1 [Maylandia zebra]|uniref:PI-PLC X domain-containing protein 1 n=1 Tax=Maylandia zebra TaxID=106582 RepID=UPI00403C0ED0
MARGPISSRQLIHSGTCKDLKAQTTTATKTDYGQGHNRSHDSVSYDLDASSAIIEPDNLKRFSWIYCLRRIVRTWGMTQEYNITMQLEAGVRYFDLRIARKHNDHHPTRLYFYHGLYTSTDVETVLGEIHAWTVAHPKEVIILAFSNFNGFEKNIKDKLHNHLIGFIKTMFGSTLVPPGIPTLQNCWDQGKNVIVSYDYPANYHPEMWKKITYYYANSMDRAQVKSKISEALGKEKTSNYFFVCGLNMTLPADHRILIYILRLCDSFPNVIRRGLPKLLKWLKQQSGVNIVASDLATRKDFVSTVVELNSALMKP